MLDRNRDDDRPVPHAERRSFIATGLVGLAPVLTGRSFSASDAGSEGGSAAGEKGPPPLTLDTQSVDRPTVDATPAGDATFEGSDGDYTVAAAGHDIWKDADEYGAVYEPGLDGDFVAEVTVESQEDTHDWAKAGIMAAQDIDDGGSSPDDIVVGVTPENGFIMDWDDNRDGYLSEHREEGSASYPCRLRLRKRGERFIGAYSTDGGDTWTTLETALVDNVARVQDVGAFVTSHERGTKGTVEFADFEARTPPTDRPTVDKTPAADATFEGSDGDYTVAAAGHDVWKDADEYGAVYEPRLDGDFVAEVTVESQEDTHDWAKAGIMAARGEHMWDYSTGDVLVGVTPENGFIMDWDDDESGYLSEHIEAGETSYPCRLRLERIGEDVVTGKYSTDGGDTWTTLGTEAVEYEHSVDVGAFVTSHERGTKGAVEFTDFTVGSPSVDRQTIDATPGGDATFEGGNGDYTVTAAGHDVWKDADEYGALYEADEHGDTVVEVTVESQEDTHDWAKAGIMIGNELGAPGSSVGDILVGVTPGNGFIMDWDDDESGYLSEHREGGSASYPCRLRLKKQGTDFVGQYSTDGGDDWTSLGVATIDAAQVRQDMGVFVTSHDNDNRSEVVFREFQVSGI